MTMTDYNAVQVGDRVRFSIVRDPKFHPERREYKRGVVLHPTITGWMVLTSVVTDARFTLTADNYISHTRHTPA